MDLLQPQAAPKCFCNLVPLGVTMSWDDGCLGARASRPHQAWHSLAHLPHLDQPGMAPRLSFGLAAAVPADRVAACGIALKLSGGQRDRMRAGRPRSQAMHDGADHSRVKQGCFRQVPPPPCWADHSRKKLPIVFEDEPRMNTNRHEERWTSSGATTLRDESPPGARASRPPQSLSQSRPSPSPGSTGCRIAGKLSGNQRDRINRTRGRCTGR